MKFRSAIRFGHALAILALAVCPGCWQEVTYIPSEPAKTTLVSNTTTVEEEPVTVDKEPAETTPTETLSPVEVTSDELFAPTPSAPTDIEPTRVEAEFADLQPEYETSAQPVSASSAEPLSTSDESAVEATYENETSAAEVTEDPEVEILRPSRTALATWRMSSRWSLAAAIYAKGQPAESYRDLLDQAAYAASLIDMEPPQFPTSAPEELQKFVASYLLHEGSEQFADELRGEYPIEYAALAEFAIKSHALLLIYTPKSQQLEPVVGAIRTAATNSGLPSEYWEKLIGMLDRREPFADVKGEVLAMHASIGDYLSGE
jgi:hypothetical protein